MKNSGHFRSIWWNLSVGSTRSLGYGGSTAVLAVELQRAIGVGWSDTVQAWLSTAMALVVAMACLICFSRCRIEVLAESSRVLVRNPFSEFVTSRDAIKVAHIKQLQIGKACPEIYTGMSWPFRKRKIVAVPWHDRLAVVDSLMVAEREA